MASTSSAQPADDFSPNKKSRTYHKNDVLHHSLQTVPQKCPHWSNTLDNITCRLRRTSTEWSSLCSFLYTRIQRSDSTQSPRVLRIHHRASTLHLIRPRLQQPLQPEPHVPDGAVAGEDALVPLELLVRLDTLNASGYLTGGPWSSPFTKKHKKKKPTHTCTHTKFRSEIL